MIILSWMPIVYRHRQEEEETHDLYLNNKNKSTSFDYLKGRSLKVYLDDVAAFNEWLYDRDDDADFNEWLYGEEL